MSLPSPIVDCGEQQWFMIVTFFFGLLEKNYTVESIIFI